MNAVWRQKSWVRVVVAFVVALLIFAYIPFAVAKAGEAVAANCGATWKKAFSGRFNPINGAVGIQTGNLSQFGNFLEQGCDFKVRVKFPEVTEVTQNTPPQNLSYTCQTVTFDDSDVNFQSFDCYSGVRYAQGGAISSMQMADIVSLRVMSGATDFSLLRHTNSQSGEVLMIPDDAGSGVGIVQIFVKK